MDVADKQREFLERASRSTGRVADLLFFHAVRRDFEALDELREHALNGHREDALVYALLAPGEAPPASDALGDVLEAASDPWVYYTLTKHFLGQDDLTQALFVVKTRLAQRNPDPFLLNLVAMYAAYHGEPNLALEIIGRSLHLCPYQRDMLSLREAVETRRLVESGWSAGILAGLYLDPLPKSEKVGFYIPAYNVEAFIRPAIEGLLAQSYPLAEILVVDDASDDQSVVLAEGYPVHIVHHDENRGLAAARNTAFQSMASDFIGTVDTDAAPDPGYAKCAMMAFENASESLAGVGGRLIEAYVDTPPDRWRALHLCQDHGDIRFYVSIPEADGSPEREEEITFYRSLAPGIFGANTVFRREPVLAVGGYDEKYRTNAEDMAMCTQLKYAGYHYAFTPHPVALHYRRDTLESVLRTQWNYDYWYHENHGHFADVDYFLAMARDHLGVTLDRLKKDFDAKSHATVYISFLVFPYGLLRDLRHMLERKRIPRGQALHIQHALLASIEALDAQRGAALGEKVIQDIAPQILEEDVPEEDLSPETEALLQQILRTFRETVTAFPGDIYAILLDYPDHAACKED